MIHRMSLVDMRIHYCIATTWHMYDTGGMNVSGAVLSVTAAMTAKVKAYGCPFSCTGIGFMEI